MIALLTEAPIEGARRDYILKGFWHVFAARDGNWGRLKESLYYIRPVILI